MGQHRTAYLSAVRIALAAAACILLLPLLAMQITDEVVWGLVDAIDGMSALS